MIDDGCISHPTHQLLLKTVHDGRFNSSWKAGICCSCSKVGCKSRLIPLAGPVSIHVKPLCCGLAWGFVSPDGLVAFRRSIRVREKLEIDDWGRQARKQAPVPQKQDKSCLLFFLGNVLDFLRKTRELVEY